MSCIFRLLHRHLPSANSRHKVSQAIPIKKSTVATIRQETALPIFMLAPFSFTNQIGNYGAFQTKGKIAGKTENRHFK